MTHRTRAGMVLLMLAQGLAGCDGAPKPPGGPGDINRPPPPSPGVAMITGAVYDSAHRPLAGAAVEVLDGPQSGTSAIADATGQFSLSGAFDNATRFRASKEGHVAATSTLGRSGRIDFYLALPVPPVNMAGEYTLTVAADSACADLPNEARTRTYGATSTPNPFGRHPVNTYLDVWVSGPTFLKDFNSSERFVITVAGDYVAFWLGDQQGQPGFVEQLSATTYVAVGGAASASVGASASSITTPFAGYIDYCVMRSATEPPVDGYRYACRPDRAIAHARCESNSHRLIWERR